MVLVKKERSISPRKNLIWWDAQILRGSKCIALLVRLGSVDSDNDLWRYSGNLSVCKECRQLKSNSRF
jgi:hypothetical protein